MEICRYCKSEMIGEYETLTNNSYYFFYNCYECKSVYEGKVRESKNQKTITEYRWFNPSTNDFEQ